MGITAEPDEGLICCPDSETLGWWCSQYEINGLNVGPSFLVRLLIMLVMRSSLVKFA